MNYERMKGWVPERLQGIAVLRGPGTVPTGKLAIGFGVAESVGEEARGLGARKALLVTDRVLSEIGVTALLERRLKAEGLSVTTFDGVTPEPKLSGCRKVQELVRSGGYDLVVGCGGGSVMDTAKVAAITATNPADIEEYLTGASFEKEGLPLLLLPTTSGTGSEVSPFIVFSSEERKLFQGSPYLVSTIALVDPLLTISMPPSVTAATGLDALSHAVEGAQSSRNPYTEALAARCVELVFGYLVPAFQDGENLEARYHLSFASVMGMTAYTQGGGLYAHSLSYLLTTHYSWPHGVGCGVSLPYTLEYNANVIGPLLDRFAGAIRAGKAGESRRELEIGGGGDTVRVTIQALFRLLKALNVPTDLSGLAIGGDLVDTFSEELVSTYKRPKNPRELDREGAKRLMESLRTGSLTGLREFGRV